MLDANARMYQPVLCRMSSVDPVDQPGASTYTYALNNPVNVTDPSGACPWVPFLCYPMAVAVASLPGWLPRLMQFSSSPTGQKVLERGMAVSLGIATGAAAYELSQKGTVTTGKIQGAEMETFPASPIPTTQSPVATGPVDQSKLTPQGTMGNAHAPSVMVFPQNATAGTATLVSANKAGTILGEISVTSEQFSLRSMPDMDGILVTIPQNIFSAVGGFKKVEMMHKSAFEGSMIYWANYRDPASHFQEGADFLMKIPATSKIVSTHTAVRENFG